MNSIERIKRIILSVILITALFIIGSIKASACVKSIAISGSNRNVYGHQNEWFNNGSINYEGSVPSTSCFSISGGGNVLTQKTNGKVFQFQPKNIGTATVTVSVKSSCLCSGVSPISRTVYFKLSEWGLKTLSVDNFSLAPTFNSSVFKYTLSVPNETTKINVKATPNQSNSTLTGIGEYPLKVGTNTIKVNVKTPQGDSRDYTLTVTRSDVVSAQSIKINDGDLTLRKADERQLSYTVTPSNANTSGLTWTSSDPSVVWIKDGRIKTLKPGTATITLKLNNLTSTIKITVTKGVTDIRSDDLILNKNLKYQLEYEVLPADATNKKVTFSVNNKLIKVSKDGIITVGNKTGTSILTITSVDSGVKKDVTIIISPDLKSISFKQKVIKIRVGEEVRINPIFNPSDVVLEANELTWTSEDTNIAKVSGNGTVTGISKGQTTIGAEFKDVSKEILVYVFDKNIVEVSEIKSQDSISLMVNESEQIEYQVLPENASIKDVTFKTNNNLITVTDTGLITAGGKAGTSVVSIYSFDGEVKKSIKVTITDEIKVTDIEVPEYIKMYKDEKYQIESKVYPDNATYKTIKYKTNSDLITVSDSGLITGLNKTGTETIEVSSADGLITKQITVELINRVEKLAFEESSYEMKVKDRLKLKLIVTPESYNLDYTTLKWTSSDNSIVEIARDGTAIAKKSGFVTIKASTEDGSVSASSSINVPGNEASVGTIILIILIIVCIPAAIIAFNYFKKNR